MSIIDTPLEARFPATIDSTMRSTFVSCPHQFLLEHVYGLVPNYPSIHLHAGGVYAKGLEILRRSYYGDRLSLADSIHAAYLAMVREWGDLEGFEDHPKSFARVVEALTMYVERYPLDTDHIKPHMTTLGPAVEFTFANPIPGTKHPDTGEPILYSGRFDMLGEFQSSLFVVDDKTCSQLGASWAQQWRLRGQFTGYCWAAADFGYPVAGAIVRGTAFKKSGIDFGEAITYRPSWMIEEWLEALRADINDMVAAYESGFFKKNFANACSAYGNCKYVQLCEKQHWERWLEPDYTVRRWDPLHNDL